MPLHPLSLLSFKTCGEVQLLAFKLLRPVRKMIKQARGKYKESLGGDNS